MTLVSVSIEGTGGRLWIAGFVALASVEVREYRAAAGHGSIRPRVVEVGKVGRGMPVAMP